MVGRPYSSINMFNSTDILSVHLCKVKDAAGCGPNHFEVYEGESLFVKTLNSIVFTTTELYIIFFFFTIIKLSFTVMHWGGQHCINNHGS